MELAKAAVDEGLLRLVKETDNIIPFNVYPEIVDLFVKNITLLSLLISSFRSWSCITDNKILQKSYDYIVVGAGSAGATVAARLSEEPVSVLLLEPGKCEPILVRVPSFGRAFFQSSIDWNYRTTPQKHSAWAQNDNIVPWNSGKGLGGGSILNAMLYVRGNKMNYDGWNVTGWSYDDVFPYFLKLEDNRDINSTKLDKGYHRTGGPMSAEMPHYDPEIKSPIIEACKAMGYPLRDINGEKEIGIFDLQATFRNQERWSTARAYLEPAQKRANLDIRTNAFVRKILIKDKIAYGVEFEYKGRIHKVCARKEVIVSAGSVRTAQLLMLSGIGPKEELEKFKIPVVADLPVGKNLQDHPATSLLYTVKESIPTIIEKNLNPLNTLEYIHHRRGVYTCPSEITLLAFLDGLNTTENSINFPNQELYFVEYTALDMKLNQNLKQEVFKKVFKRYIGKALYLCFPSILQPRSRGTITLNCTDPKVQPVIDPNYYENEEDLRDMVEGVKICNAIAKHPAMKEVQAKLIETQESGFPGCEDFKGDDYWGCLVRSITHTVWHPAGTAKMGNPEDSSCVVDPRLRVKGVKKLRVVDASIFPTIPSANTNIPTIMVAEKASDMIKEDMKENTNTQCNTGRKDFFSRLFD